MIILKPFNVKFSQIHLKKRETNKIQNNTYYTKNAFEADYFCSESHFIF